MSKKKTKIDNQQREKQAKIPKKPSTFWDMKPSWRFSEMDWRFEYLHDTWEKCDNNNNCPHPKPMLCITELQEKLKSFESRAWKEILEGNKGETKGHRIHLNGNNGKNLEKKNIKALRRLENQYANKLHCEPYESIDHLYSLRINSTERFFGLMDEDTGAFSFLWWDPKHRIWPTEKRHT